MPGRFDLCAINCKGRDNCHFTEFVLKFARLGVPFMKVAQHLFQSLGVVWWNKSTWAHFYCQKLYLIVIISNVLWLGTSTYQLCIDGLFLFQVQMGLSVPWSWSFYYFHRRYKGQVLGLFEYKAMGLLRRESSRLDTEYHEGFLYRAKFFLWSFLRSILVHCYDTKGAFMLNFWGQNQRFQTWLE